VGGKSPEKKNFTFITQFTPRPRRFIEEVTKAKRTTHPFFTFRRKEEREQFCLIAGIPSAWSFDIFLGVEYYKQKNCRGVAPSGSLAQASIRTKIFYPFSGPVKGRSDIG